MKISIKALLASFALTLLITYLFAVWSQNSRPQTAEERLRFLDQLETQGAPELQMTDLAGKTISFKDFQGKVVVLNFWASWCSPCLEEFPSMIKLFDNFGSEAIILAVSQDSNRADIDAFLKAFKGFNKPGIHIVYDEDKKIGSAFEVDRLPESFVFGPSGKLVKKIVGSINWYSEESKAYIRSLLDEKR